MEYRWELDSLAFKTCECGSDMFNIDTKVLKRYTIPSGFCDRDFGFYEFTCVSCGKVDRKPTEPAAMSRPYNWEAF